MVPSATAIARELLGKPGGEVMAFVLLVTAVPTVFLAAAKAEGRLEDVSWWQALSPSMFGFGVCVYLLLIIWFRTTATLEKPASRAVLRHAPCSLVLIVLAGASVVLVASTASLTGDATVSPGAVRTPKHTLPAPGWRCPLQCTAGSRRALTP